MRQPESILPPLPPQLLRAHKAMLREIGMIKEYETPTFIEYAIAEAQDAAGRYFLELERYCARHCRRYTGGEQYDNRRKNA